MKTEPARSCSTKLSIPEVEAGPVTHAFLSRMKTEKKSVRYTGSGMINVRYLDYDYVYIRNDSSLTGTIDEGAEEEDAADIAGFRTIRRKNRRIQEFQRM